MSGSCFRTLAAILVSDFYIIIKMIINVDNHDELNKIIPPQPPTTTVAASAVAAAAANDEINENYDNMIITSSDKYTTSLP